MLQVALNITKFRGESKFSTWLYVVIANCARQTYRSLKRRAAERSAAELPADLPDPRTTSVIAGSRLDLLDGLERLDADRPGLAAVLVLRDLVPTSLPDHVREQLRGHRPVEVVPLAEVTSHPYQRLELSDVLDALGHDLQTQVPGVPCRRRIREPAAT